MPTRFLVLQVRDPDDPMGPHEVECFARALDVPRDRIETLDLLTTPLDGATVSGTDVFLLGGSGDYSAAGEGDWLERALDSLRVVHGSGKPTFASCWGFQAMARAMGGRVVRDLAKAEVGTHALFLTDAGAADPVFSSLGSPFKAQMGHEDRVAELPPNTTLLASSEKVENQAYRFDDAPIYCTQFHPELRSADLELRFRRYPQYVERVAGISAEQLARTAEDTPEASALLPRFLEIVVGTR